MSQLDYSTTLLRCFEAALDRDATILGETEGPEGVPPVKLALFPSTDRRPVAKLTTVGMSRQPLTHPTRDDLRVELAMSFPSAWQAGAGEDDDWPIHELVKWATYPLIENLFIWRGQTLTTEPIQPIAPGIDFCGWLAAEPAFVPEAANPLDVDDRDVHLVDLIPLYREELDFADEQSAEELLARLQQSRTSQLVTPHRRNVCA